MKLYIRLENNKPAGSPTSKNKTGYVEYTPYTKEFDDDQMQLIDTYDSASNSVTQSIIERSDKNEQVLKVLRAKRNELLDTCDWTQIPDNKLSDSKKTEWQTYRQALRDITKDPSNVTWPTPPSQEAKMYGKKTKSGMPMCIINQPPRNMKKFAAKMKKRGYTKKEEDK